MAEGGVDPQEVVTVPDTEDDWPEVGPQNPAEARAYVEKINTVFNTLGDLLHDDQKDAMPKTVRSLKHVISRHWSSMSDADAKVVIRSIQDPMCGYLRQHVVTGGIEVMDPDVNTMSGHEYLHQLPDK